MEIVSGLLDIPLTYVLTGLALTLLYLYSTWTFTTWSKQGIAGPYPLPFVGNLLQAVYGGGFHRVDLHLRKKYGKFVALYTGRLPVLGVSDPDFLKEIMVKQFPALPNRLINATGGLFNLFLTGLKDDHWRHVRSSLTPTFTTGKLKQMRTLIDECADRLVVHMTETNGKPFDTKSFSGCYTMDVIASTAFGIQVDSQKNPDDPILTYAQELMGSKRFKSRLEKVWFLMRVSLFFLMPEAVLRALSHIGLSPVSQEAVEYFSKLCNQILDQRDQMVASDRKDFVELCKERLIPAPQSGDPDYQVDERGEKWTANG